MTSPELVVLADTEGNPIGTAEKATVHTANTPLHLAFSCYVHNGAGEVLLTRRALTKLTWPGVWTNSACGHLAPGETALAAVVRRVPFELGLQEHALQQPMVVLEDFRYQATDSRGVVENELCPVFLAELNGQVQPRADEVDSWAWVRPQALLQAVDATPFAFSPWMVAQLQEAALRDALLAL